MTSFTQVELALQVRRPTKAEQFWMKVDTHEYRERAAAGEALSRTLQRLCLAAADGGRQQRWIGFIGGFPVQASAERDLAGKYRIDLELVDVPDSLIRLDGEQLGTTSPAGLVIRLENRLGRLEDTHPCPQARSHTTRPATEPVRARTAG